MSSYENATPSIPDSMPVTHIVGIWTEVLLYGIYCSLFFESLYIMLRKRKQNKSASIFLVVTSLMYIIATSHIAINLYGLLRGYVYHVEPLGPAFYFVDYRRWDVVASNALAVSIMWLGDALVIYRCFVIWSYNYYIIVLPLILLVVVISFDIASLFWATHFELVTLDFLARWVGITYVLIFSQNVITTGLIAFKIWKQHRCSSRNGVVDASSKIGLFSILRIVIESAAIYTVQILMLLILYPLRHEALYIIEITIVPSTGIVFALTAVRVHLPRSRTIFDDPTHTTALQNCFSDGNTDISGPDSGAMQLDREKGVAST